jgi:Na+/glutamate symporter
MSGDQFDLLLKTFAIVGVLLLVGTFLRAKVKIFQQLYLPACVIGGAIGLILGPRVLGWIPMSDAIMNTASNMPGKLFSVIIAAMPMCAMKLKKGELFKRIDALTMGIIITMVAALQFAAGFLVNVICNSIGQNVYAGYGSELMMGYCGGYGVCATIGNAFKSLGQNYWEVAQGIGMTFSTIGMIGGILIGIAVINIKARKKETHYLADPNSIPKEMKLGVISDPNEQPSAGKQTTSGGSIDTIALHLALIMLAVGIGYIIEYFVVKYNVPGLCYMTCWFYALIVMYIIWPVVRKLGWDKYFDANIKSSIQGFVTDFIVTAAIMSMPLEAIMAYWLPILITAILGFIITVPPILFLDKHLLQEDWVEKSMGPLGMMTGDFITGMMLTRMVDPDFKSNAIADFSIAYSINTFYCVAMLAVVYPYVVTKGAMSACLFTFSHAVILAGILVVFSIWVRRRKAV